MSRVDPADIWEVAPLRRMPIVQINQPPQPLQSAIVASAARLTDKNLVIRGRNQPWQQEAWEMFDLVGEQRFLLTTLAERAAKAPLYLGRIDSSTDQPVPLGEGEHQELQDLFESFGGGRGGRSRIVERLLVNFGVAGEGWVVGVPQRILSLSATDTAKGKVINATTVTASEWDDDALDLSWQMLSVDEVQRERGHVTVRWDEGLSLEVLPDDLWLIRCWKPHPRYHWEADSPTRSSLPVLRELVGLTMHISAQVDSRLAGAGMLVVPASARRALMTQMGLDEEDSADPFTDALIEAMVTPIQDRASASAVVPLVVTVPDDVADKFNYLTFDKQLDTEARALREESIRRLALSQDAPPELLLGTGGMNHWGAWLVQEDVVSTHIAPPLALICDALTTQFLWPACESMGMAPEQYEQYVIWFDVSDLTVQPNRSQDALALHERNAITDEALRRELSFDESDAPVESEEEQSDPAVDLALDMVRRTPSLAMSPGLPALVADIRLVLSGDDSALPPAAPIEPTSSEDRPAGNLPEGPQEADVPEFEE